MFQTTNQIKIMLRSIFSHFSGDHHGPSSRFWTNQSPTAWSPKLLQELHHSGLGRTARFGMEQWNRHKIAGCIEISGDLTVGYWTWPSRNSEFSRFPMKNMVIFHSCVRLPEGTPMFLRLEVMFQPRKAPKRLKPGWWKIGRERKNGHNWILVNKPHDHDCQAWTNNKRHSPLFTNIFWY